MALVTKYLVLRLGSGGFVASSGSPTTDLESAITTRDNTDPGETWVIASVLAEE